MNGCLYLFFSSRLVRGMARLTFQRVAARAQSRTQVVSHFDIGQSNLDSLEPQSKPWLGKGRCRLT